MTNEEMAKDLVGSKPLSSMITTADLEKLAVEMAEWKEQQMIDKAWDWILRYSPLEFQKEMEKVFRKAMEE